MNTEESASLSGTVKQQDTCEIQPRSRPVSFRLTPDEYREVERIYAKSGARSISDFARDAVMLWVASNNATARPEKSAVVEIRSTEMAALRELQAWIRRILTPGPAAEETSAEPGDFQGQIKAHIRGKWIKK